VDFICHAASLVIEIDGGLHFEPKHEQRDARRDAFLASKGLRVLRFSNHDVMTNRAGVLETIAAAIEHALSLTLPRKRGEGTLEPLVHDLPHTLLTAAATQRHPGTCAREPCGTLKSNIRRLVGRATAVA
jgi:hypothetical protein